MAVLVLAQVDIRRLAAGAEVDEDLRLLRVDRAHLRELRIADLGLGGEVAGPVVEHLQHGVLGVAVLGVPVAGQADGVGRVALHDRLGFLGALVGQARAMVVGDVPVQLHQVALVFQVDVAAAEGARGQAEILGRGDDAVQVAGRDLVRGRRAGQRRVQAVGRIGAQADRLLLLEVREEEQLVLDDRAAQRRAGGPVALVALVAAVLVEPAGIADQLVRIAVGVVHRSVEFVRAALGHRVDVGADGIGGHVEVRGRDVVLLDGVGGHRRADVRHAVRVQAKRVADGDAVDADVVVTAVLAHRRHRAVTAIGDDDARVEAGDILDRTTRRRRGQQLALRHVGRQALVVRREGLRQRTGRNGHAFQVLRFHRAHGQVHRRALRELQVDLVLLALGQASLGCRHVERTADAQTLRRVTAIRVGGGDLGGARRLVHDLHGGARDRLAVRVEHAATDRGGGVLRDGRHRRRQQRSNGKRQEFGANSAVHS